MVEPDASTRVASASRIVPKLIFSTGEASVEEYELKKDEVVIGRSKSCDVVIMDKKSSRRNTSIERHGVRFVVKDLNSSNGTYVNGAKVTEKELDGEDEIRIGDTRFHFKVMSRSFEKKKDHLKSAQDLQPPPAPPSVQGGMGFGMDQRPEAPLDQPYMPASPMQPGNLATSTSAQVTGSMNLPPGMTGIDGTAPSNQKMSLLQRYRALPERKRLLYLVSAIVFVWFFLFDDEPIDSKQAPENSVAEQSETEKSKSEKDEGANLASFNTLSPKQQQFVENQYQLGSNFYYNKEYDKAIFEIQKIFQLVSDYKNSKEILRYAEEGKRRMEAQERERRRKEEERRVKAQIQQLVSQAKVYMKEKNFQKASALFPQILSLDPENKEVASWQNEIDEIEEEKRLAEQQRRVQKLINEQGEEILQQGEKEIEEGRFPAGISTLNRVQDIGVSDKTILKRAEAKIKQAEEKVKGIIEPLLAEAKSQEEAGNYEEAYQNYQQASKIDSRDGRGQNGMERIEDILHEKVKVMYTEAVLSESYSDFTAAKKLYEKCISAAPEGDLYKGRCQRKLERYKAFDFMKEDEF